MEELIKNESLIDDCQVNGLATTYTLMNLNEKNKKTKLGEVLNYLPHGIIDKTETGIGGTSLELDSNRHSIVVVPFNNIADCKSQIKSIGNKYDVHFYSSDDYFNNNNVTYKLKKPILNKYSFKTNDLNSRLDEYIIKCEEDKQPIKIICIINQLEKLYENLKNIKNYQVNDFHLVLDEIDTLQEQSSFRDEATKCYNIYKEHPPEKSTMISATLVKFHDPYFLDKPLTIFKYKKINKPKIYLTQIQDIKEEAVRVIINLILNNNDKILVSCNNFKYSHEIIETLEKELKKLKKRKTIKIICSNNSKKSAEKYYAKIEKCELPADITFMTAAFFSGHDITERYHNIILADKQTTSLRISPRLIYQITGRCRDEEGPYSNQLIINFNSFSSKNNVKYDFNMLKDIHVFSESFLEFKNKNLSNVYYKKNIEHMENLVCNGNYDLPSVSFKNEITEKIEIAYNKIDCVMEDQNSLELYSIPENFIEELKKRFEVNFPKKNYNSGEEKLIIKKNPNKAAIDFLKNLILIDKNDDYNIKINQLYYAITKPINIEYSLREIFLNALGYEKINMEALIKTLLSLRKDKLIVQKFKFINYYIKFNKFVLCDKVFQNVIITYFPIGQSFTNNELIKKTEDAYRVLIKSSPTENKIIAKTIKELINDKTLFKNSLLDLTETRTNKVRKKIIIGYDVFKINEVTK